MAAKTNIKIKVQLDKGAYMPEKAHDTDTGYDLKVMDVELGAFEEYEKLISPDEMTFINPPKCKGLKYRIKKWLGVFIPQEFTRSHIIIVDTGVHVQPEEGYWVEVVPNSRVGKRPFFLGNSVGIIDEGYTGSIKFIYKLCDWGNTKEDVLGFFERGAVCGQMIIHKRYNAVFEKVKKLDETERKDGGFGSTEKKTKK